MNVEGKEINRSAIVRHSSMGLLEVNIEKEIELANKYYVCTLKKVLKEGIEDAQSAIQAQVHLNDGQNVSVFVRVDQLVEYID